MVEEKKAAIGIQIFQTGSIRIRPTQVTQPTWLPVFLRRLRFLTDFGRLTEPIPIYAFLITHPDEGNILFDLGETPRCVSAPDHYPWWQIGQYCVSMDIKSDDGLADQLKRRGVDPRADIKAVVISHLHSDHAGGLLDFYAEEMETRPTVYTSAVHWDAFRSPFYATIEGANPRGWPPGFEPSILRPDGPAIGPWPHSYPITADGRVLAVDTPGHVPGHVSLIIDILGGGEEKKEEEEEEEEERAEETVRYYFLVGDAAYNVDLLDAEMVDGINADPYGALESQRKIKEFCRGRNVVVLPSHEFDSVRRLREGVVYRPSEST